MIDQPERLHLKSLDVAEDRIALLREDFPEVFRDGRIDFDALRRTLGDSVEPENERFGLQWPGKAEAFQAVQTPSAATLRPDWEGSVDWDSTQNLIIEGDNLEVLKLLQKSYYGKVKMIYIDPPYNTGNDFIYPDNYREGLQSYLEFTGQVDGEGKKISTNTETAGRYHSNWLNMMYPRLFLARNLLRADGVIYVTIDDTEVADLRQLMDEVFGSDNFVAAAVWQKTYSPANDKKGVDAMHDYILVYSKSSEFRVRLLPRTEKQDKAYLNPDNDPRGVWKPVDASRAEHRDYAYFEIKTPAGNVVLPASGRSWVFNREDLPRLLEESRLWFGQNGSSKPSIKRFLTEVKQGVVPTTWWPHDHVGHNDESKKELKNTFNSEVPFDTPKPTRLIRRMLDISVDPISSKAEIVLDFFAGSGSTGHAVMKQNAEDGGNRKYILVQLPESIDPPKVLDDGTTLSTIADITRERVRRAGRHITGGVEPHSAAAGEDSSQARNDSRLDVGFRSYKLASSNFTPWDGSPQADASTQQIAMQLEAFTDNVLPGRGSDDILAEITLKLGYELTAPVERLALAGHTVFALDDGAVLVCLDTALSLGLFEAMVERNPGQIVCLDAGFQDDDELKVNATQVIRSRARSEESTIRFWVV